MGESFTSAEVTAYLKARLPEMKITQQVAQGRCPFHNSKHIPFVVNLPSGGFWRCQECNRYGNLIELEVGLAATQAARDAVFQLVGRLDEKTPARGGVGDA